MNAQHDNPDGLIRLAMNSNSSATLVDLSEGSGASVDVMACPTPFQQMLQSAPTTSQDEKSSGSDLEGLGSGDQIFNHAWTGIGGRGLAELSTPKGKGPELASGGHSQYSRDGLISPTFGEYSRTLPPLPASPDPTPMPAIESPSSNPFLDPQPPSLPPVFPNTGGSGGDKNTPNMGVPQWLLQAGRPTFPPQLKGILIHNSIPTDPKDTPSNNRTEVYDAKWAKHMEERSQRIQAQQREEPASLWGRSKPLGARPNNTTVQPWFRSPGSPSRPHPQPPTAIRVPPEFGPESWRRRLQESSSTRENQRPDIQSRNTALGTISNILFNFDCPPEEAAALLEDVCATANEVGVSTVELLAQTVTIGNFDLGMTALCLEASRCDLSGGLDVLMWLLENVAPGTIERELRHGCLMRNNGMGDQVAWSTMKLFVPEQENQAVFSYDVTVENIYLVPGTTTNQEPKKIELNPEPACDSDDDGSLYDDVSLIDAESSLNQADIETLKSSDDEADTDTKGDPDATTHPLGPSSKVHRACINIPYFESSLKFEDEHILPAYTAFPPWSPATRTKLFREGIKPSISGPTHNMPMKNRVLTAEWMHEGRVWALGMGNSKLILTLRHASEVVSRQPVKIKAFVRIFPADVDWDDVEELGSTGPDRLLKTRSHSVGPPITPSYTCEFDETLLVPGPAAPAGNSSLWKEDIYMSRLSLLDIVGMSGAMKVEVVIKTTEATSGVQASETCLPAQPGSSRGCEGQRPKIPESVSGESDAEWQKVDP
ncbi:hypothetical protein FRC10_007465 [Ceratobasidium sp. 414]|nr:hypothetical protein FRC10_007465 [Ceratobasidium sp. 414]